MHNYSDVGAAHYPSDILVSHSALDMSLDLSFRHKCNRHAPIPQGKSARVLFSLSLFSYKLFVGVSSVLSMAGKISTDNDTVRKLILLLKLFNVRNPRPYPLSRVVAPSLGSSAVVHAFLSIEGKSGVHGFKKVNLL